MPRRSSLKAREEANTIFHQNVKLTASSAGTFESAVPAAEHVSDVKVQPCLLLEEEQAESDFEYNFMFISTKNHLKSMRAGLTLPIKHPPRYFME